MRRAAPIRRAVGQVKERASREKYKCEKTKVNGSCAETPAFACRDYLPTRLSVAPYRDAFGKNSCSPPIL